MMNIFVFLITQFVFAKQVDSIRIAYDYVYSNPKKAIELANRIIKNSDVKNDQITARLIKTNAYSSLDDSYNALKYAFETYEYVKKEKDIFNEARILGRIGELFQLYGFNTQSREYLEESEQLIRSKDFTEVKRPMYLGNIYAIRGNGYKDDLDCDFAIKYYDKSIKEYKKILKDQGVLNNLALVYIEKSNCLIDKSKLDSATYYLDEAFTVIKKNNLKEYDLSAKISLAKIYQAKGNYDYSNQLLKEVIKEIETSKPLQENTEVYKLIAKNSLELKDYKSYKNYIEIVNKSNKILNKNRQDAQEKSLNYLFYKDQGFLYYVSFFKIPIFLLFVLIILLFRKKNIKTKIGETTINFRNNKT